MPPACAGGIAQTVEKVQFSWAFSSFCGIIYMVMKDDAKRIRKPISNRNDKHRGLGTTEPLVKTNK